MRLKDKIESLEKELIAQYRQFVEKNKDAFSGLDPFNTTEISDATNGKGVMDSGIKPLDRKMKLLGRALTVLLPPMEGVLTLDAISAAEPGDILVIQTGGTMELAVWGDVKTIMAMKKRIGGVVIDGAARDSQKIIELGFPVFSRNNVVKASGKAGGGILNEPLECGGVLVNPGDFVMGDADGVIVIPAQMLELAIEGAQKKLESDQEKIYKVLTT